jgi:hypothetical protein
MSLIWRPYWRPLLGFAVAASASGIVVGNWAIRTINDGLAMTPEEQDRYVKEKERRFVRAMNMGTAMDEEDE